MPNETETYGIATVGATTQIPVPTLDYLPAASTYRPKIGLIGAGGITEHHLRAYQALGLDIATIADPDLQKTQSRCDEFFPDAIATTSAEDIFNNSEIEVIDIATHPAPRVALIESAIAAGKHILSQKPFVTDLAEGQRLCDLADKAGVKLAINQNGRWAPHYRWAAQAIRAGLLGRISSVDMNQQFDHTWTAGTPFEDIHHLLLYDFGIHWFDFAQLFTGGQTADQVFASVRHNSYQTTKPPFLAHAVIDYPDTQARITLNAHVSHSQRDSLVICGEKGTLRSHGDTWNKHTITLETAAGIASPDLHGDWLTNGFQGTMMELLSSIEQNRTPENNARANLKSLALCFAAMHSADTHSPQPLS
jgi:predicted dehydrogenase